MGSMKGSVDGKLLKETRLAIKDGLGILAKLGSASQGQGLV